MRILFDARSVRTATGRYVLQGLAAGMRDDPRVTAMAAAAPPWLSRPVVPDGIDIVPLHAGWVRHLWSELPRVADRWGADVIFSPNATPPRDPRSVLYFQDLFHFRVLDANTLGPADRMRELSRALWRAYAAPMCMLGVATSEHIANEAAQRVSVPLTMIPNGVTVGDVRWVGSDDRVLVMGGGGARKGEVTALRAWAELVRAGATRDTVLEIGGIESVTRREELLALARTTELGRRIRVTHALPRESFLERIATARLAVSCSTVEAFGLPVAEALAIGAPLVCSDIPAHCELVRRAGAGATFSVGDHRALADAVRRALDGEPPPRLHAPPMGWDWGTRATEHVDAYLHYSRRQLGAPQPLHSSDEKIHVRY
ncbi:MAG: glycosyltransferase [Gemmatimonadota bacterium]|nr:glycosyltransferase [Gemmatimonadota bacterium]